VVLLVNIYRRFEWSYSFPSSDSSSQRIELELLFPWRRRKYNPSEMAQYPIFSNMFFRTPHSTIYLLWRDVWSNKTVSGLRLLLFRFRYMRCFTGRSWQPLAQHPTRRSRALCLWPPETGWAPNLCGARDLASATCCPHNNCEPLIGIKVLLTIILSHNLLPNYFI